MFSEYRALQTFVKNMPVTNDIAERGCHMITEFANRVKSAEARSNLLQVVSEHRAQVKGFTKDQLEKY